jgi:hypothetical protein
MLRRISSSILGAEKQGPSRSASQASVLSPGRSRSRSVSPSPATPELPSTATSVTANAELSAALEALQSVARLDFDARKRLLISILSLLVSDDDKTAFAEGGGFLAYASLLASLELPPDAADEAQAEERLSIVRLVFETLARSFQAHDGNRRLFARIVGFTAIVDAIRLSDLLSDSRRRPALLGLLWAFLLNDFSEQTCSHFTSIIADVSDHGGDIGSLARSSVSGKVAENAALAPVLLDLVREDFTGDTETLVRLVVICSLEELAASSLRNRVMLNEAGTFRSCLDSLWSPSSADVPDEDRRLALLRLARALLEAGVKTCEARSLLQHLVKADESLDDEALELL